MRSRFLLPILLMSLAGAVPVSASPLDITNIIGQWQNAVGGPLTLSDNQAGQGVDRIRWGAHTGWSMEGSGYDFTPGANILGVTVGTPFVLGTFTHHNQTIPLGTEITAVQYALQFQTNGLPGVLGTTLNFFHNETPNTPPPNCPPGTIGMLCADVVTMSAAFVGGPVTVGNEIYTFTLLGFSPDGAELQLVVSLAGAGKQHDEAVRASCRRSWSPRRSPRPCCCSDPVLRRRPPPLAGCAPGAPHAALRRSQRQHRIETRGPPGGT